jgi:hypothetical protein
MKRALTMIVMLTLLAGASLADDQVRSQTRYESTQLPMSPDPQTGCEVGNLNDPYWTYGNWIMGGETYAYLINPPTEGCTCGAGFKLERVYMMMEFGPEDVPVTFDAYAGLAEAVWDEQRGAYVPGADYCTSPTWSITANSAGLYDIYLDLSDGCPCAATTEPYFITFHLPYGFTWWPSALEDNDPQTGISYYDSGNGWADLVGDFGWWGKNIMHADVTCCSAPVSEEGSTWGGVKSLWR